MSGRVQKEGASDSERVDDAVDPRVQVKWHVLPELFSDLSDQSPAVLTFASCSTLNTRLFKTFARINATIALVYVSVNRMYPAFVFSCYLSLLTLLLLFLYFKQVCMMFEGFILLTNNVIFN